MPGKKGVGTSFAGESSATGVPIPPQSGTPASAPPAKAGGVTLQFREVFERLAKYPRYTNNRFMKPTKARQPARVLLRFARLKAALFDPWGEIPRQGKHSAVCALRRTRISGCRFQAGLSTGHISVAFSTPCRHEVMTS